MTDAPTPPPEEPPQPEPEPGPEPEPVQDPQKVLADNRRLGRESAAMRKELKDAQTRIEEMTKANMNEVERALAEAETRGVQKGRAELLPMLRDLTFSNAASGKMAEPELAGTLLADAEIDFTDGTAVASAIDALIEKHPSLAAGPGTPAPASSFPQGPRGNGETPAPTMNDVLLDAFGYKKAP